MSPELIAGILLLVIVSLAVWIWKNAGSEGDKFNNSGDI